MKRWAELMAVVAALFLGGGYLASQLAYMNGRSTEYAVQMDQPSIRIVATLLLVTAIGLGLARKSEEPE